MDRSKIVMVVYIGALVATLELAGEILTGGYASGPALVFFRIAQALGLGVCAWGIWQLRRTPHETVTFGATDADRAVALERLMTAYTRETLTHLRLVLLVILVGLTYAVILDFSLLAHLQDRAYYLFVIIVTFGSLTLALVNPMRAILREERRLKAASEAPLG